MNRLMACRSSSGDEYAVNGEARLKKTIWRPLVLGLFLGSLAAIATVTGLSFLLPGPDETENVIGFFMILFLLSAALGGPLAGAIAPTLWVSIVTFFGPPDMKAILSDPVVFWSNMIVVATIMILVGFAYRLIFERLKMPARLLPWAGIVIAAYIIITPTIVTVQYHLLGDIDLLPAILFGYQTYIPQAIFDIFFTSLVFIALPPSYAHPVWYELDKAPMQSS